MFFNLSSDQIIVNHSIISFIYSILTYLICRQSIPVNNKKMIREKKLQKVNQNKSFIKVSFYLIISEKIQINNFYTRYQIISKI